MNESALAAELAKEILASNFMMALFIGSTALVGIVPVFLGLMRQPDKRNKTNKGAHWWLFFSFLTGIIALIITWDWFGAPNNFDKLVATAAFGFQIVFLLLGSCFYWRQSIEES